MNHRPNAEVATLVPTLLSQQTVCFLHALLYQLMSVALCSIASPKKATSEDYQSTIQVTALQDS